MTPVVVARTPQWRRITRLSVLSPLLPGAVELPQAECTTDCSIANRQAECSICFEPLCTSAVAVLTLQGGRVCRHHFHKHCIEACPTSMGCPLCRAEYSEAQHIPPLSQPAKWFEVMDYDQNGQLDQKEVLHALQATLPVDLNVLEAILPALWTASGYTSKHALTYNELLGNSGILRQLHENLRGAPTRQGPVTQPAERECPDINYDMKGWFAHWDTDGSGVLEREEVVRGLCKTFRSDVSARACKKRLRMRCIVEEMWGTIDTDGNDRITLEEFSCPGGLAELVLQKLDVKVSPRGAKLAADPSSRRRDDDLRNPRSRRQMRRPAQKARAATVPAPRKSVFDDRPTCHRQHAWSMSTDLSDDGGANDCPSLLNRPALGFCGTSAVRPKRKTVAQWAGAIGNLNSWAVHSLKHDLGGPDVLDICGDTDDTDDQDRDSSRSSEPGSRWPVVVGRQTSSPNFACESNQWPSIISRYSSRPDFTTPTARDDITQASPTSSAPLVGVVKAADQDFETIKLRAHATRSRSSVSSPLERKARPRMKTSTCRMQYQSQLQQRRLAELPGRGALKSDEPCPFMSSPL